MAGGPERKALPSSLPALLPWWLGRLAGDAGRGLAEWVSEPERPLLLVAGGCLASFLLHWLGYRLAVHRVGWPEPLFAPTEWEGRTGWRKPLVFGISTAMVFVSLRQGLRAQRLVPRALVAHLAAWSAAVEVAIITLQAWRGVPSHFNTSTTLDAALYAAKLLCVVALSAACLAVTAGVLRGASRLAPERACALRHGLPMLCLSAAIGFAQVAYGHSGRSSRPEEAARCLEVTAGAAGSPCYEVHGQAAVKLAHFLPLHATELLLLLAWAAAHARGGQPLRLVQAAAAACWCLSLLGILLTVRGEDIRKPETPGAGAAVAASLACIAATFVVAYLAPLAQRA